MLDTGLLHQLRPVCALRPSALLRLALDGSLKDLTIQVKMQSSVCSMQSSHKRAMAEADGRCSSDPSLIFCAIFQGRVVLVEALDAEAMTAIFFGLMLRLGLHGQQIQFFATLQGINAVAAEKIMRRLLPGLPALRFQQLMRVVCHEILHHIQDDHPTRQAWILASLSGLANHAISARHCANWAATLAPEEVAASTHISPQRQCHGGLCSGCGHLD